jgi:hypothetical protein
MVEVVVIERRFGDTFPEVCNKVKYQERGFGRSAGLGGRTAALIGAPTPMHRLKARSGSGRIIFRQPLIPDPTYASTVAIFRLTTRRKLGMN